MGIQTEVLMVIGLFAVILFIIISAIIAAFKRERKRKDNWREIAKDIGFEFSEVNNSLIHKHSSFKTFGMGRDRQAKNVMLGKNGDIDIAVMDYQYVTGSGKQRQKHYTTICLFSKAGLNLPSCYVRMQIAFFDFLGKVFGGQDIDFVEDPDFSKAFVLQGDDEKAVRELFDESVRKGFMEYKGKNFVFEGEGNVFLINKGQRIKPEQLTSIFEDSYKIMNLFSK